MGCTAEGDDRAAQSASDRPISVVYHLSDGDAQTIRAMNNIANHLRVEPRSTIVVVVYGQSISRFTKARASEDLGFNAGVAALQRQGVRFEICRNSMNAQRVEDRDLIAGITPVASGVVEIAALQSRHKYAYLRP